MPLEMNREVFITCAVTGSGATQDRSPHVPRSPREIADSAIAAAKAGAAVVHCHVRDPETGAPSRDPMMFREVTDRIRDADFEHHSVIREGAEPDENAPQIARFLDIPPEKALEIAETPKLFAD